MSGSPRSSEMPLEIPAIDAKPRPQYIELDGAKVSPEAWEFSAHNRLVADLTQGLELARKHFLASSIRVCVEHDPEVDDASYLVIELEVSGTVSENVLSHRKFASEAAKKLGPNREFIKLCYDIK
jgi:hypothetical protein